MTTYNCRIGEKIWEWHSQRRHPSHWEAWSVKMHLYRGKREIVFQFVEYGLTAEASARWSSMHTLNEDDREDFIIECNMGEHTDYSRIVDQDFLRVDRLVWDSFKRDYYLVIDEIIWDKDFGSLRKLPRSKMSWKNTTTIGE